MPYRLLAATELAEFLRALAHPRRIQILEELRSGERDVASLAQATGGWPIRACHSTSWSCGHIESSLSAAKGEGCFTDFAQ